jgi:hypothetical protein
VSPQQPGVLGLLVDEISDFDPTLGGRYVTHLGSLVRSYARDRGCLVVMHQNEILDRLLPRYGERAEAWLHSGGTG